MKKTKKILALFLAVIMLMGVMPMTASAVTSGKCGGNLTWSFNESTGELVITGTGAMYNYGSDNRPWESYENSIKSVTIGDSVTTIGYKAFSGCDSLTSVTIGDSVTTIGYKAFSGCDSLTSVTIGDSVTTIGSYAFAYCNSLTSVTIPDSVTTIGDDAFENCTSLETVTIGDSVTTIGSYAFAYCNSLTSVTIPDSVTTIGSSAFYYTGYYNDDSNWENEVLYIGDYLIVTKDTISGDYSIKNGTKVIADSAFAECDSLESVIIPDSVTTIGRNAFYDFDSLTSVTVDADNQYYSSDSYGVLYNKDKTELIQYPIGNERTLFEIPDSVTTIGNFAFSDCDSLVSVTIPDSVTTIGDSAFYSCYNLTTVTIGDSVTTIGDSAFSSCDSLTSVTIGDSVTTIGDYAFSSCDSLTSVTIEDSVTTIGDGAFRSCNSLTSVTIPDSVTTIGEEAFVSCNSLESVTIGDSVTTIGYFAFSDCNSLESVTIGDSVTTIGDFAFAENASLKFLRFNSTHRIEISNYAFYNSLNATLCCKENSFIHSYAVENGLRYCIMDGDNPGFEISQGLLVSYIGNSENIYVGTASMIGYEAFHGNKSVKTVELSSGVERIFNKAFADCSSLEKIIIPQGITSIGDDAFDNCNKLTIWCYAGSYAESYAVSNGIPFKYITLTIADDVIELDCNESKVLTPTYNVVLIDETELVWSSDNSDIVSVDDNGKVTAKENGEATITATASTGLYAKCTVKVGESAPVETGKVNSVEVDNLSMNYKDSATITPNISADEGVEYTVTYSSSDPSVAAVNENGNVYAAGEGSAEITVTVTDEYGNEVSDTCEVKVSYAWWQWIIRILLLGFIWY